MNRGEAKTLDYARAALAVCQAVDAGDVETFAALVDDFEREAWIGLAEQALHLLRDAIHEVAALTACPISVVYGREFETLLREEARGVVRRNLVLDCLRRRFAQGQGGRREHPGTAGGCGSETTWRWGR